MSIHSPQPLGTDNIDVTGKLGNWGREGYPPVKKPYNKVQTDPFDITLGESCKIVLRALLMKNKAPNTLKAYKRSYKKFLQYVGSNEIEYLGDITQGIAEGFQMELFQYRKTNGKSLNLSSIANNLAAMKTWGRVLLQLGYLESSPFQWVETPTLDRPLHDPVPMETEMLRILHTPDIRVPRGYRDRSILELLYGSALRVGELCELDIHDVDVKRETVTIRNGKAGSSGVVPMGPVAAEFLDGYISRIRPLFLWEKEPRSSLFLGVGGDRIWVSVVEKMVARVVAHVGIKTKVTPHTFRATAATHMLQRGANLRTIQEFLRHKTITSTEQYLRMTVDRSLEKVYRKYHPREKM